MSNIPHVIDGHRLKQLMRAGAIWLKQQEEVVNAYNVYPVPDGDTGTNMSATMNSAWKAIENMDEARIGVVAKAISNGALRGSRGNSGIILSQIWRGFAAAVENKDDINVDEIAAAFREAAVKGCGGKKPRAEGPILPVTRKTADAAAELAQNSRSLREMISGLTKASYESVQRTPNHLKILKEAGVIDSGGYGLYIVLDGMRRFVNGEPVDAPPADTARAMGGGEAPTEEGGWGYDVQYLIYAPPGTALDINQVRADIEAMGDCPLVIGDEQIIKVHVHVPDPGVPLSYGVKLGSLRDVVVEDMQAQSEEFKPGETKTPTAKAKAEEEHADYVDVGIVAVASGDGLARMFKEVGARVVVFGGQTMNPSVEDLLNAIDKAKARSVILLPNNGNIIMAANQAAQISEIPTRVVPTRTLPQGIAASLAFNFEHDLEQNVGSMNGASGRVTTGEVTISTRDVTINDVSVRNGQIIGLIDDKLRVAGEEVADTLLNLLTMIQTDEREVVTMFYGNNMSERLANEITDLVREKFPNQAVDLYHGGQPHYYFVVGVE
ncbi:MAG: DAK2 domain-containing protein [Anaerolineae bacterium]|nr:DAK2 domain-containing protein [Anaerolineae bacterium]